MDPNANLDEIRRLTTAILAAADRCDEETGDFDDTDVPVTLERAVLLAERVEELDRWLKRGGFLRPKRRGVRARPSHRACGGSWVQRSMTLLPQSPEEGRRNET